VAASGGRPFTGWKKRIGAKKMRVVSYGVSFVSSFLNHTGFQSALQIQQEAIKEEPKVDNL
jgi:hypothetical protein